MMTKTAPLTTGQATADAGPALRSAGIEPQRVQSIWTGYQPFLGLHRHRDRGPGHGRRSGQGRQGTGVPARR